MIRRLPATAAMVLAACTSAPPPSADQAGDGNPGAKADAPAVMSLRNTTWEFDSNGTLMVITVDRAGAYIEEQGDGTHVDHGTYVQKDGKDCFITAMGDKGTNCWTGVPDTKIGGTASASNDRGESGVFKRVAYRTLKLP